jgi:hypothetical protein
MQKRVQSVALLVVAATTATGCGAGSLGGAVAQAPTMSGGAHGAAERPLLVDWGPNDRALLNRSREKGPLVVKLDGGSMQPLFACQAKGSYTYTAERSSQVQDDTIDGADELHAKLPAFGAKFEAELARSGKLHVRMRVAGSYAVKEQGFRREDLQGECTGATHVASHVTVGAFRLYTSATGSVKGEASTHSPIGPSAGGSSKSTETSLNEAGDEGACSRGSPGDQGAPDGCSTSLQLVLTPLGGAPELSTGEKAGPWIVGGVGVAGLILAGVAGGLVLANNGAASSQCSSLSLTCTSAGNSAAGTVSTFGPVTTVGLVVGAAGIAAGGIWLGLQRRQATTGLRIAPTVGGSSWKLETSW